jgi:hypothetical protein
MQVRWSGSGLMKNTEYGHHQNVPVFYTLKESLAVGKAPLRNISRKTLRQRNQMLAQAS